MPYTVEVRTVAVISQKGGVGKSLLTCSLAVAAMLSGLKAGVVDTDPQASATQWGEVRTAEEPVVVTVTPSEVAAMLADARSEALDVVFIDSAPRASAAMTDLVREADFALIPLLPSGVDVATAEQSAAIARAAGKPFAFVLNACPARAPEVRESREALAELGPVCAAEVGLRRAFGRAFTEGLSAQETEPTSDAARDLSALFTELWSQLNAR